MPKRTSRSPVREPEEVQALFDANRGLVYHEIGRNWRELTRKIGMDQVEQEGLVGLYRAAELWTADRGAFSTYATSYILNYLRTLNTTCRGRGRGNKHEFPQHDMLHDTLSVSLPPDEPVLLHEQRERMQQLANDALQLMTPRQADVVRLKAEDRTLAEVGVLYGVGKERIRQIIGQGRAKLQESEAWQSLVDRFNELQEELDTEEVHGPTPVRNRAVLPRSEQTV